MNTWQCLNQLSWLLRTRTWTDAPNELVFARVLSTAGVSSDYAKSELRFPYATVKPLGYSADEYKRSLKNQRIEVGIAAAHSGDRVGEFALMGGQWPATTPTGGSKGRGLLEIEEELENVVNYLAQHNGIRVHVSSASSSDAAVFQGYGYVIGRTYELEAILTTERTYTSCPRAPTATALGAGQVSLSWTLPAYRFDFHAQNTNLPTDVDGYAARGGVIVRRAAGSTAPSTATSGTGVTLSSSFASSVTDSPGAGQFSYSVFISYGELAGSSSLRYSSAASVTVTAT